MSDAVTIGRRFFEELLGKGDASVADEILADDVVMYHPSSPTPVTPRAAVQGFLGAFRAGFPDMRMTVEDAFGSGEKAAVRWHMQGTHTENLFGMPPTGKAVSVKGISVVRVVGGKIVEDWVSEDTMGLMQQLGIIPPMG